MVLEPVQRKLSQVFEQLEAEFAHFQFVYDDGLLQVKDGQWLKWATRAQHLIHGTFGERSVHYKNFEEKRKTCVGQDYSLKSMYAVFEAAREDYEGGFNNTLESQFSGQILGDFVLLARQSLSEGHKDVSAVLASAALEDALKRFARKHELDVDGKLMPEVIRALKSKGLIAGAQKAIIDAMPNIRNAALHAEWHKIGAPEVSSMIGFVESLLLQEFS